MDAECLLPREGEDPRQLPLSLLETITNNFSEDMKLGSGGFAVVYKGVLGSRKVAVKKLSGANDMDEKQFIKEIECLMKVRHKNIVRFLGYCADTQGLLQDFGGKSILADVRNRALCFEYVPKGSLDKYITDASCGLEWRVRYKMIKGICEGLHYLHKNQILHLDLKPANILVDDNMIPKIADFGLSRLLDQNQSMIIATTVMGSLGYFAPECYDREFSKKSDVYSLGVVIMEIMSGKKFPTPKEVIASWRNRREKSQEDIPLEHVKACADIGAMCINNIAEERPTTQHIIKVLTDMGGTDEFKEAGSSNSLESQVNVLIACVAKNLGYSAGKPVAAVTIYKCLLHWKSLEADKTSLFNRFIQLIESAIQTNEENNDMLAYWLTNTSSLLFLLHRSIKAASISRNKPPQLKSLFGRMVQGLHPASFTNIQHEANDEVIHEVEAKYPALLFKQQLTAYVEKIYGMVRDNMKRKLSYLISLCVQAPRTMKARNRIRRPSAPPVPDESQSNHWVKIIEGLDNLLMIVQDNHVPDSLAQNIFMQIFTYINVQLFNSVLLRRECCSFSNGEYIRAGLSDLESWCAKATTKYAASSWDELKHIRQAVGFLVIFHKFRISYDEIVNDLCPILSVQQLYRICTQYWDDKYNTQSVSSDVLSNLRVVMTEDSKNPRSDSFLLDDNASIPFTVDDITNSQQDFSDVRPAKELLDNPDFEFLQDH